MAKETSSANTSLLWHEMLESEFMALHGELPADYPDSADPGTRLKAFYATIHRLEEKRAALCLSGGGIRSASFALGVVQGLAQAGLLDQFDYLSTVSGGGYTGGWLTAWVHRAGSSLKPVIHALSKEAEPLPLHYVRAHCCYLNPGNWGAIIRLAVSAVWNILLQWLVLLPVFILAIMAPRLVMAVILHPPKILTDTVDATIALVSGAFILGVYAIAWTVSHRLSSTDCVPGSRSLFLGYHLPGIGAILCLTIEYSLVATRYSVPGMFLALAALLVATTGCGLAFGSLISRTKIRSTRLSALPLVWIAIVLVVSAVPAAGVLIWIAISLFPLPQEQARIYVLAAPVLIVAAAYIHFLGSIGLIWPRLSQMDRDWLTKLGCSSLRFGALWIGTCFIVFYVADAVVTIGPAHALTAIVAIGLATLVAVVASIAIRMPKGLPILNVAFGLLIATFLVTLTVAFDGVFAYFNPSELGFSHLALLETSSAGTILSTLLIAAAVTIALSLRLDINEIGVGSYYRASLVRTFLGASVGQGPTSGVSTSSFASMDIPVHSLSSSHRPFPVINMAAKVVNTAASQEARNYGSMRSDLLRESFTVTALHAGSYALGYRPIEEFAGGMTLGTAIATSGAAVTPLDLGGARPSMPVSFLLTALGVRLGRWVGNPGPDGSTTSRRSAPRWALPPLASEALGLTDERNAYVYLSDGGHYDNLGLFEMVGRRCHFIVISDASQDEGYIFEDLGNVARRSKNEWGVPMEVLTRREGGLHQRFGLLRICYSIVDGAEASDGLLIYLKPVIYGDEPASLQEYYKQHTRFPQDPTSDQWFDEPHFEAYRKLGLHTIESLTRVRGAAMWTLSQWFHHVIAPLLSARSAAGPTITT